MRRKGQMSSWNGQSCFSSCISCAALRHGCSFVSACGSHKDGFALPWQFSKLENGVSAAKVFQFAVFSTASVSRTRSQMQTAQNRRMTSPRSVSLPGPFSSRGFALEILRTKRKRAYDVKIKEHPCRKAAHQIHEEQQSVLLMWTSGFYLHINRSPVITSYICAEIEAQKAISYLQQKEINDSNGLEGIE